MYQKIEKLKEKDRKRSKEEFEQNLIEKLKDLPVHKQVCFNFDSRFGEPSGIDYGVTYNGKTTKSFFNKQKLYDVVIRFYDTKKVVYWSDVTSPEFAKYAWEKHMWGLIKYVDSDEFREGVKEIFSYHQRQKEKMEEKKKLDQKMKHIREQERKKEIEQAKRRKEQKEQKLKRIAQGKDDYFGNPIINPVIGDDGVIYDETSVLEYFRNIKYRNVPTLQDKSVFIQFPIYRAIGGSKHLTKFKKLGTNGQAVGQWLGW